MIPSDKMNLILTLIFALSLFSSPLSGAPITVSDGYTPLTQHLEYWVEESGRVSFEEAQKQPFQPVPVKEGLNSLNLGYDANPVWVRVTAQSQHDGVWVLEQDRWYIHQLDLYIPTKQQTLHHHTGSLRPFSQRFQPSLGLVFPLEFRAREPRVLYLRFETWQMLEIQLGLWEDWAYHEHEQGQIAFSSAILGTLGVVFLIGLFMVVVLREKIYLLYVAYVASFAGMIASLNGIGGMFFWPDAPLFNALSVPILGGICLVGLLSFFVRYLGLKTSQPFLYWSLQGVQALSLLVGIFGVLLGFGPVMISLMGLCCVGVLGLFVGAIRKAIVGEPRAKLFLVAWTPMIFVLLVMAGRMYFPWLYHLDTFVWFQVSVVFQGIFFAYIFASQILSLRQEVAALALAHVEELDQKILERTDQLEVVNQELTKNITEKNDLLGIVAHDLKNPTSSIVTVNQLLSRALEQQDWVGAKEINQMIGRSSEAMMGLIAEILEAAVIESQPTAPKQEKVELVELISDQIQGFAPVAADKQITFDLDQLPHKLQWHGPKRSVQHILNNLISNAVKYSPLGGVVSIGYSRDTHTFWIKDQGAGIPEDEQEKLFKKFSRTSVMPTGGESSTGLGLFIAQQLAEAIGAIIGVESATGAGSRFWLRWEENHPKVYASPHLVLV